MATMNTTQAPNVRTMIAQRMNTEQNKIALAIKKGHLDPLQDSDQKETLILPNGDRRFITDFIYLPDMASLEWDQVRHIEIDTKDCKRRIAPLISRYGLNYPIMIMATDVAGKYRIVHGHNRAWTLDFLNLPIPAFVLTAPMNLNGNSVSLSAPLLSKIRPNPALKSRPYGMDCAVGHIGDLMRTNPTIDGKNPSGKLPPRHATKW